MRLACAVGLAIGLFSAALMPGAALAASCADRQLVCFDYCERQENNSPKCLAACRQLLEKCVDTGCWDSKITARRCGFTPQ